MSKGSTDFLVQRYIENAPNSMAGAWVDEGIARDLKADEAAKAVEQVADPKIPGRRRASRWDFVSEHNVEPGPASVSPAEKHLDEPFAPEPASSEGQAAGAASV